MYCNNVGIIKGFIMKKYNMMDIGIGISHLWLAVLKKEMTMEFLEDQEAKQNQRTGYYYVISLNLKK